MKSLSELGKKKVLVVIVSIALVVGFYLYVLAPKKETYSYESQSISSIQSQLDSLKSSMERGEDPEISNQDDYDEFLLNKKVPVGVNIEQFIEDLEQVEYVTRTAIESISFGDGDTSAKNTAVAQKEKTSENGNDVTNGPSTDPLVDSVNETEVIVSTDEVGMGETEITTIEDEIDLPEKIKAVTVTLDVKVKDYESLLLFLSEIESLERIIYVESIGYSLLGEETLFAEKKEEQQLQLVVTTFYVDEKSVEVSKE